MLERVRYGCWLIGLSLVSLSCLATIALAKPERWGPRIGSWYTAPHSTPPSDAIVILGGSTFQRVRTGVELYKNRVASHILITGHNPDDLQDWQVQYVNYLLASERISEENVTWVETNSTFEDAQRIEEQLRLWDWQQIIVVSHWFHGRRALCTIDHVVADDETQVAFVPATTDIHLTNWWQFEDGILGIFTETFKLLYYNVKYHVPLGSCWRGGMNPIKIIALSTLSLLLSFLLVAVIRRYALRKRKLDIPNGRSSHRVPTPRGGGLAIVSVTVTLLFLSAYSGVDVSLKRVVAFVIAGLFIAGTGWVDDWWKTLSARTRLGIHFTVAGAFIISSGVITGLYLPLLGELDLYLALGAAVTLFWIAGLINAYNFMDGSDGLAGTQAFFGGSAWMILFFLEGQETLALLSGLLAASSLGFLALNAPPAKIFLGDVGSTFLGFAFSALPVIAFAEMENPRLLVSGALIVGVFVFDATYTILRRMRKGENLLQAHRSHLYQRLIKLEYSHATVCALYAFLITLSAMSGLVFYFTESEVVALGVLLGVAGSYLGLAAWVSWLESHRASGSRSHIRLTSLETDK